MGARVTRKKERGFSEFSFGFAYTYELATLWAPILSGSPIIPNQQDEAKDGGGWDVRLKSRTGYLYFAQYKLAQHLNHPKAKEQAFGMPYYRFPVYGADRSRQHELLLVLDSKGHAVEYVAPRFWEQSELDRLFSAQRVRYNVMRVRPSVIGALPDRDDHRIVYHPSGSPAARYSDPAELKQPCDLGEITADGIILHSVRGAQPDLDDVTGSGSESVRADRPTVETRLREVESDIRDAFESDIRDPVESDSRDVFGQGIPDLLADNLFQRVQWLARITLGAELFLIDPNLPDRPSELP